MLEKHKPISSVSGSLTIITNKLTSSFTTPMHWQRSSESRRPFKSVIPFFKLSETVGPSGTITHHDLVNTSPLLSHSKLTKFSTPISTITCSKNPESSQGPKMSKTFTSFTSSSPNFLSMTKLSILLLTKIQKNSHLTILITLKIMMARKSSINLILT